VCAGKLSAPAFESSLAVANHFRPRFTGKREELVIAVFLNGQNQRLGEKDITEGTPTQAIVYIRRILEGALHESAAAIVLVHNHPSGNPDPSVGDDIFPDAQSISRPQQLDMGLTDPCSSLMLDTCSQSQLRNHL
jgi:DNA repair protein RadC